MLSVTDTAHAEPAASSTPTSASAGATVPLRIATWNLNHWRQPLVPMDTRRAAWQYARDSIGAQVVLAQEAVPPSDLPSDRVVYTEIAGHRNWGSAAVALDPALSLEPIRSVRMPYSRRRHPLGQTAPGSVAVARLRIPGIQEITLVSVYGLLDGSVVSSMLHAIADLVPLFDSPDGARVILAGDLNVSTAGTDPKQMARAHAVFEAIRSLGLIDAKTLVAERPPSSPECPCGNGGSCDHIATWGRIDLDHLFLSPALADQVTSLTVDRAAVEFGLSDHAPLVLDLVLTTERTPHVWDEESFAEEIGRRHGPSAREVVEKLVNWADHKERELTTATGVCTKRLTRFPINGCTVDPELWLSLDLDLAPRATQGTISIRAKGEVVVQFGSMRQPPFDQLEMREDLRQTLNEIEGVDIPANKVRWWPTFPLAALENPARLHPLVSVLDRIASETRPSPIAGG